jgi:hypothetical protein
MHGATSLENKSAYGCAFNIKQPKISLPAVSFTKLNIHNIDKNFFYCIPKNNFNTKNN